MMLAFHGKEAAKTALIKDLEIHAKHDEFLKGTYHAKYKTKKGVERFKGCAVGCTIGKGSVDAINIHKKFEHYYGIPSFLAHIEDDVFERLPIIPSKSWPLDFAKAVPVGADLTGFEDKILRTLLRRKKVMDIFERFMTEASLHNLTEKLKRKDFPIRYAINDLRADMSPGRTARTGMRKLFSSYFDARNTNGMVWGLCILATADADAIERAYAVTGYALLQDKASMFLARLTLQLLRSYKEPKEPVTPSIAFLSLQRAGINNVEFFKQIPKKYRPISEGRYNILRANRLGDVD
jgi:hypothetical protein